MIKDKISIERICSTLCFAYVTGQLEFETLELFLHTLKLKFFGDDYDEIFQNTIVERYSYLFK